MSWTKLHFLWVGIFQALCVFPAEAANEPLPESIEFIFRDEQYMTPDQKTAWRNRLGNEPGITGVLVTELWRNLEARKEGSFTRILYALTFRDDLTEHQLQEIKSKIQEFSSTDIAQKDVRDHWLAKDFVCAAVPLLEKHRSSDNEDVALALLNKQSDFFVRYSAAVTLGKIGTERSLDAVRNFVKSEKPPPGGGSDFYSDLVQAQQAIEMRLANSAPSQGALGPNGASPKVLAQPFSKAPASSAAEKNDKWWVVWLLIIIAGNGGIWFLIRKATFSRGKGSDDM